MPSQEPLTNSLPASDSRLPESDWIHTTSVTGPHGITASVKDWTEVLDWQEHRRSLTQGYYRLIPTPQVRELTTRLAAKYPEFHMVALTSAALARKEMRDLIRIKGLDLAVDVHPSLPETLTPGHVHVLSFSCPAGNAGVACFESVDLAQELFERNRRRGGSLSSRVAEALLTGQAEPTNIIDVELCNEALCTWEDAEFANLYPSGMAAVTAALCAVLSPERPRMIVLGNVYRDTHLLLEEQVWAGMDVQTDFLDTDDLQGLSERIGTPGIAGVLVETITNPLIEIPDLPAIGDLCREAGVPLLVDSTMAGPLNAKPLALGATLLIHSTSKYLSGHNTHGGGVILTRDHDWASRLQLEQSNLDLFMAPADVAGLKQGIDSYPERLKRFNRNGEALAELLRGHPAVGEVYYGNQGRPDWLHGLAGVVSCELEHPSIDKVEAFFESPLPGVIKAPSLGSDQTLFCPYVLLAYYDKDDEYIRQSNLSKTLFRFAMGSEEDITPVLDGIRAALDQLV